MNIMSSKINYIFNQGFQNTFTPGYLDSSSVNISQSTTKEGNDINSINDSNLNNRSSTEKGLGEYFDISFNNPFDVSNLESIIIYSAPEIKNYLIQKVRYETTGNVKLDVSEIQLWVDNKNIVLQTKTPSTYAFLLNTNNSSLTSTNNLGQLDLSSVTNYLPTLSSNGIELDGSGQYINVPKGILTDFGSNDFVTSLWIKNNDVGPLFNKVTITLPSGQYVHFSELQVWVGGQNLALKTAGSSARFTNDLYYFDPEASINGTINKGDFSQGASTSDYDICHSNSNNGGTWELTLPRYVGTNEIQCVIIYNRMDDDSVSYSSRSNGWNIQFLNDTTSIYSKSVSTVNFAYKIKGGSSEGTDLGTEWNQIDATKIISDNVINQSGKFEASSYPNTIQIYDDLITYNHNIKYLQSLGYDNSKNGTAITLDSSNIVNLNFKYVDISENPEISTIVGSDPNTQNQLLYRYLLLKNESGIEYKINELQIWHDNSNIMINKPIYTFNSTLESYDVSLGTIRNTNPTPTYDWDFRTTTSNSYILDRVNSQRADFSGNVTVDSSNGAYFEGNLNSYINLDPFLLENSMSWECYYKLDSSDNGSCTFGFTDNLTNNSSDQDIIMSYVTNSTVEFQVREGSSSKFIQGGTGNIGNIWHHYAGYWDSSNNYIKLYQNGVLVNSATTNRNLVTKVRKYAYLGKNPIGTNGQLSMQGYIRYFRVWNNKVLTDLEILSLYQNRDSFQYLKINDNSLDSSSIDMATINNTILIDLQNNYDIRNTQAIVNNLSDSSDNILNNIGGFTKNIQMSLHTPENKKILEISHTNLQARSSQIWQNISSSRAAEIMESQILQIPNLYGWYKPENLIFNSNNTVNEWRSLTGSNHITAWQDSTSKPVVVLSETNSLTGEQMSYVYGRAQGGFDMPHSPDATSTPNYTLVHVTRRPNAGVDINGRIWSAGSNVMSGHHGSSSTSYFYHNDSPDVNTNNTYHSAYDLVVYIDTWNSIHSKSDGKSWYNTSGYNSSWSSGKVWSVNGQNYYGEASDWHEFETIYFDRILNQSEINILKTYLDAKYLGYVDLNNFSGTSTGISERTFDNHYILYKMQNFNSVSSYSDVKSSYVWKKVFKQTVPYLWTSGSESSPLENMKNHQLNTESNDNYSIMNEIFNSSTRDNYKYNGAYKFKMINTQGYELIWTQTGNPFDYTDAVPGTVSNVSATNFTLSSGNAWDFDGLNIGNSMNQTYLVLDGVTGDFGRYLIGQISRWSEIPSDKIATIPTDSDHLINSDWVELYAYAIEYINYDQSELSQSIKTTLTNVVNPILNELAIYDYTNIFSFDSLTTNLGKPNKISIYNDCIYFYDNDSNLILKNDQQTNLITKVVGNGTLGDPSENNNAIDTSLNKINALTLDDSGNIYMFVDQTTKIWKVSSSTNKINSFYDLSSNSLDYYNVDAMTFNTDYSKLYISSDLSNQVSQIKVIDISSQTISDTSVNYPAHISTMKHKDGYLYIGGRSITGNNPINGGNQVWKISTSDYTHTVLAGQSNIGATVGQSGVSQDTTLGDLSLATSAKLGDVSGIEINDSGDIFISDTTNNRIRKIDSSNNFISTFVGDGSGSFYGNLIGSNEVKINHPTDLIFDTSSNLLYFSDFNNRIIRKIENIDPSYISRSANTGFKFEGSSIHNYILERNSNQLKLYIDGTLKTELSVKGLMSNVDHQIGYSDRHVNYLPFEPQISTFAGTGTNSNTGDNGLAVNATLNNPQEFAFYNNLMYIACSTSHNIRKIDLTTGIITTIAGTGSSGNSGDGSLAINASLNSPGGIAVDSSGNVYVSSIGSGYSIRKIDIATGIITNFAGTGSNGYTGDGGLATNANISQTPSMIFDSNDNLYFGDRSNHVVRKINKSDNIISTIVTGANNVHALAIDTNDNIYIGGWQQQVWKWNQTTQNYTIIAGTGSRVVGQQNVLQDSTIGDGGPATDATFNYIHGLAVDSTGNVYIGDLNNCRVRKIDVTTGIISTYIGDGYGAVNSGDRQGESTGDGGLLNSARVNGPACVGFDKNGSFYITDGNGYKIRKVQLTSLVSYDEKVFLPGTIYKYDIWKNQSLSDISFIYNDGYTKEIRNELHSYYQTSTVSSLANAFDLNINTRAETNTGVGEYFDLSFIGFDMSHVQSLIIFNNTPNNDTRLLLYDDSDNIIILNNNVISNENTDTIIKYKGESYERYQKKLSSIRVKTNKNATFNVNEFQVWVDNSNIAPLGTITQSSTRDAGSNANDSSLNTFSRTQQGLGEYIDLSLNYPVAANRIQSVILYSDILQDNNPLIKRVRIETTENYSIEINELQIWVGSSNIVSNFTGNLSTTVNDVSLAFDNSFNTNAKTNSGIGEYIDLSSNTGFNYNDLQTIIYYSNNDLSNTKIILYDDYDNKVIEHITEIHDNTLPLPTHNWDFRQTATTTINDSISGVVATYNNGLTSDPTKGLDLSDDNGEGANNKFASLDPFNTGTEFSMEFYFQKTAHASANTWPYLIDITSNPSSVTTGDNFFAISWDMNTEPHDLFIRLKGTAGTTDTILIDDANVYAHVVVTFNDTTKELKQYLNGSLVLTDTINVSFTDTTYTHNYLGASPVNTIRQFNSYLYYFRYWKNEVLSSSDVSTLYANRATTNYISNLITTRSTNYNVIKYKGPQADSVIPRFNRMRFDTYANAYFNINELQVWVTDSSKNFGIGTSYDLSSINIMPNATISANTPRSVVLNTDSISSYSISLPFVWGTYDGLPQAKDIIYHDNYIYCAGGFHYRSGYIWRAPINDLSSASVFLTDKAVYSSSKNRGIIALDFDSNGDLFYMAHFKNQINKYNVTTQTVSTIIHPDSTRQLYDAIGDYASCMRVGSDDNLYIGVSNKLKKVDKSFVNSSATVTVLSSQYEDGSKIIPGFPLDNYYVNDIHVIQFSSDNRMIIVHQDPSNSQRNRVLITSTDRTIVEKLIFINSRPFNWESIMYDSHDVKFHNVSYDPDNDMIYYINYPNFVLMRYELKIDKEFALTSPLVSQSTNQTEWFDGVDGQLSSSSLGVDTNKLVSDNLGNLYFSQHGNGNNNTNGLYYNNFQHASGFPNIRKLSVTSSNLPTNIIDNDFSTSTITSKSSNSFIEVAFNKSYDVSSLSSVVAYSTNLRNVNPLIGRLRIESTTGQALDLSEIQVWYDNSNVATLVDASSSNLTDGSINTNYLKNGPVEVSFNPFKYDSLQAIVIYNARSNYITPYYTFDASSYNFNGSGSSNTVAGSMIDMPGFVHLTGNSPKTIEAYVSTTDTDPQFAVQLGEITTNKAFALRTLSGKLSFMGFSNDVHSDISINDGNVHRVAISYDGNVTLKFFSDSTVETKTLAYQLNTGSTDAKVGAMNHSNSSNRNYWNGTIGKVNIYNKFISSLDEVGENEINDLSNMKLKFMDEYSNELFDYDVSSGSYDTTSDLSNSSIFKIKGKQYDSSIPKLKNIRFSTYNSSHLNLNEVQLYIHTPVATWSSTTYSQLGQTLTSNDANDRLFSERGMSSDGLKIIGANQLDPTADSKGTIQAYSFNGNAWVTYGSLIEAQASEVGESAYSSIADMTDDGTRIFVGWKPYPSTNTEGFGKVYDYVNGDWSQVGDNIFGDNTDDQATRTGKISGDGTTIAHMGGYTDTASTRYCKVRRYQSSTNTWNQIGSNIAVALTNKNTDKTDCLAISQTGNIVAIGSNNDGTSSQGAVRIYEYNSGTSSWSQLGSTILGENANDEFGISLDMNDDGTVIIVGAWKADDTGSNDGNARVFEYTNGSWTQVGSNIIPNTSDNDPVYFGNTVRVSGNGKFFAVSGYQSNNPAGQNQSGETRVYIREGNTFTQIINTIYGDQGDFFGSQIFLNTDGTILAVGSGGFNTTDLHPMELYQLSHSYNNNYSNTNVLSDANNIITQSSTFGSDVSSQVNDLSFNTMARTQKGVGEFIDILLNTQYDVSNIQGIIAYTSIHNDTNPTISKIRYQTTSNVKLKVGEFQVWVDNSNIASKIDNSASSIDGIYDLSNLNDSNLYTYVSTNQGIGEYVDISLNKYFNFNDLQGIVTYVDETANDLSMQDSTKIILFDETSIPVIEYSNQSQGSEYKIYKYKGPSHVLNRRKVDHFKLETINYSSIDINEIQMWVDGSNLLHDLSNYTITYSDQSSTDVSFNNNDVSDSFRIEKGLGKFIDVSLNTLQDLSKIESIVYYSTIKNDYNPMISKVRFETIGNVKLEFNEIQIWQDNSNLGINRTITQSTNTSLPSNYTRPPLSGNEGISSFQINNLFDNPSYDGLVLAQDIVYRDGFIYWCGGNNSIGGLIWRAPVDNLSQATSYLQDTDWNSSSSVNGIVSMAFDSSGILYYANGQAETRMKRYDPNTKITTTVIDEGPINPIHDYVQNLTSMAFDSNDFLYTTSNYFTGVYKISKDFNTQTRIVGQPTTDTTTSGSSPTNYMINNPTCIKFDKNGKLYILHTLEGNNSKTRLLVVSSDFTTVEKVISPLDAAPAESNVSNIPGSGFDLDDDNNLFYYIRHSDGALIKYDLTTDVQTQLSQARPSQSSNPTVWFNGKDESLKYSSFGVDTFKLTSDLSGNLYFSQFSGSSLSSIGYPNARKVTITSKAQDLNLDTSASTLQGVNEFMDIDLYNMRLNDLQSIVTHRDPNASDLSNQKLYRLKMYDDSNVPFIILDNSELSQTSSIHKYKGPSHDNLIQKLSNIRIESTQNVQLNIKEVQLWIDGENVIANRKFQPVLFTPLVATQSVTNYLNYNGNLMNWPQSIFGGAMGSNPKTVSGLTGDLAVHNGTYTITYSSAFSFPHNNNKEHRMFSASENNQYSETNNNMRASADIAQNLYSSTLDGNGYPYVGNNSLTYYDSSDNLVTVNGEWIAFEFPAYINFTVFHSLSDDYSRAATFIGVDSTGTNRLIGSYSNTLQNGGWTSENLTSNYYVNKFYWVITKKSKNDTNYMQFHEIFFDGNYQISPAQYVYPNNSTITSSIYDTSFTSLVPYVPKTGRTADGSKNNISTEHQFNYNGVSYNVWEDWYKYSTINDIPSTGIAINSRVFSSSSSPHIGNYNYDGTELVEQVNTMGFINIQFDSNGILYGVEYLSGKIKKDILGTSYDIVNYVKEHWQYDYISSFCIDNSGVVYYTVVYHPTNLYMLTPPITSGITPEEWNTQYGSTVFYTDNSGYLDNSALFAAVTANNVKIIVQSWNSSIAMNWGVYVDGQLENPDFANRENSSNLTDTTFNYEDSSLDSGNSWVAGSNSVDQWTMIKYSTPQTFTGLKITPRQSGSGSYANQYITSFKLEFVTTSTPSLYDQTIISTSMVGGGLKFVRNDPSGIYQVKQNYGVIKYDFNSGQTYDVSGTIESNSSLNLHRVSGYDIDSKGNQYIAVLGYAKIDLIYKSGLIFGSNVDYNGNPWVVGQKYTITKSDRVNDNTNYAADINVIINQDGQHIKNGMFLYPGMLTIDGNDDVFFPDYGTLHRIDGNTGTCTIMYGSGGQTTHPEAGNQLKTSGSWGFNTYDFDLSGIFHFSTSVGYWSGPRNRLFKAVKKSYRYMNLFDNASITYTDNSSSWTEYRDSINHPYYIIWKTNGLKTVNNLQLTGVFDNSQYMPKQFDIISYNGTIADFENTSRVDNLQAISWNTITSINETIGYDQQLTKTYDFNNHDVSYIGIKVNQNFVDSSNSNVYINDINWRFQTTLVESSDLSDIVDSDLNSYILLDKGVGKFIDISLNTPADLSSVESIVVYADIFRTNPQVRRIRLETMADIAMQFSEIQVWTSNSANDISFNLARSSLETGSGSTLPFGTNGTMYTNDVSSSSGTIMNAFDGSKNTYFKSNQGTGEYVDIQVNGLFFNDIQSVITYSYDDDNYNLSYLEAVKIILYDNSNLPFIEFKRDYSLSGWFLNTPSPSNIFDFRIDSSLYIYDSINSNLSATIGGQSSSTISDGLTLDGVNDNVLLPSFTLNSKHSLEMYFYLDSTTDSSDTLLHFSSKQQDLIVNNGNYTGLTETTIATGVPTNTEIEIVSYTLTNTDSAAVSNIAFTKYHDQNNVFVLYGVLLSGRSAVLKITFSISSEGVLTIQHNGSVIANGYDQLTSETASNSYDDPLLVYGPTNGGADYHYFTDLIIRYSDPTSSGDTDFKVFLDASNIRFYEQYPGLDTSSINNWIPASLVVNQWNHLVFVSNSDSYKINLYVNNQMYNLSDLSGYYPSQSNTKSYNYYKLGSETTNSNFLPGKLKYFRIWNNNALTTNNVQTLYANLNNLSTYGTSGPIYNYYKFKGPAGYQEDIINETLDHFRITTTNSQIPLSIDELQLWVNGTNILPSSSVITQSSTVNQDNSANTIDTTLSTKASTQVGLGEFIDVSLNTPIVVNNIQSLVVYSTGYNYNPLINKIRYITTDNVSINLNQVKLFKNSLNIIPSLQYSTTQGTGNFIDISTNLVRFNEIESIETIITNSSIYDPSQILKTKIEFYDVSDILFAEINNENINLDFSTWQSSGIQPDTNFNITYRGTKVKKLAKVRIETTDNIQLGLEELQLWSENNNVIAHYDPDKPTNTFILTDSTRSLTDIYSSNSLTLVGNPGFDNDGVHLIGSQYITIPQSILDFSSNDFTISLWTQTSVASGTPHILSMGYNNTNSWLLGSDGNVIQLYGYQQTSTGDGDTDVNFTVDNQATNYIISRVGNKMKLFINGVLKLDLDISVSLPAQDYHIGYSLSYGSYYSGAIKRLDIWKGTGFSS